MLFGSQSVQRGNMMMINRFAVLICTLAALSTAEAVRILLSYLYWNVAFIFMRFYRTFCTFRTYWEKEDGIIFLVSLPPPLLYPLRSRPPLSVQVRNSTFIKALNINIRLCWAWSVSLVLQVGSVFMGAPPSHPWLLVNTCFVCVLTVSRGRTAKPVRISTANRFAFISFTILTTFLLL